MDAVYLFRVEAESAGGAVVLKLRGSLDAHTTPDLEYEIARALAGHPSSIVLDLSAVRYISSTGFGVLLDSHHGCKDERSELRLACIPPSVGRVFGMLGLEKVLRVFPSVTAALAADPGPGS